MKTLKVTQNFIAAGALLLAAAAAQAQQQAYTAGDTVLFSGPGDDYPFITDVDQGYPLDVFGCTGGYTWCDVGFDGYRGWIDGRDVEFPYGERRMPVFDYGPRFRLPIITFSINSYWDRWYYNRPFYVERPRWERHAPPPVRWEAPRGDWDHRDHHDPDHDRGGDREHRGDWDHRTGNRDDHRDDGRDHHGDDRREGRHDQPANDDRRNYEHQLEQGNALGQRRDPDALRNEAEQQRRRDQSQRQQQDEQRQRAAQQSRQQDQQRQQQDLQRDQQRQRQQQEQQRQQQGQQRQQQEQQPQPQPQAPHGEGRRQGGDGPRGGDEGDGRDHPRQRP